MDERQLASQSADKAGPPVEETPQADTPLVDPPQADIVLLIESHQAGLWRYLRVLGCNPTEAEDLTQETFLSVLEKPFVQYSPAATAAYLRKVAHNLYITFQRRNGRVSLLENVEEIDALWTRWAGEDQGDDLLDALRGCLEQLTERARKALEMRFREDDSRADIAAFLEMTEHGAKNLMQRAKKQLRTCIDQKIEKFSLKK